MSKVKEYSNGEITIVWKPDACIHSGICARGLAAVFQPKQRPWIKQDGADSATIMKQIDQCPSGALSYYKNAEKNNTTMEMPTSGTKATVIKNGPLLVMGNVEVTHPDGSIEVRETRCSFCRCGASANKPFCDGAHKKIGFEG